MLGKERSLFSGPRSLVRFSPVNECCMLRFGRENKEKKGEKSMFLMRTEGEKNANYRLFDQQISPFYLYFSAYEREEEN